VSNNGGIGNTKFFDLWSVIDKLRIGAFYAVILEAFKLGS